MIIKATSDKEKAKSSIALALDREDSLKYLNEERFPTTVAETHYEIIKELIISIMLIDGFKATGENAHKETIEYLKNYKEITSEEIMIMDDLRIKRNKSSYEGKRIDADYLRNNKHKLITTIEKLKNIANRRIK